ncbi:MAG: SRPBCC family protein [Saprospiraceae bacterium]
MKYLKYFLGIIAVLALLFIGKGILTPSLSYSSEIIVDKPIKEAWAVMNDESKISQWLKGIKDVKHVSGEKGKVGAVTQYTFDENGQESVILETIKTIRPNEHINMDFVMEGVMAMDYQVDFTEKNGKTHITSSTVTKGIGMLMRSMVSFMKSSMQDQEDENMGNLKKLIEGNTTNYFPVSVMETIKETQE